MIIDKKIGAVDAYALCKTLSRAPNLAITRFSGNPIPIQGRARPKVYKISENSQNHPVLTAPDPGALPRSRQHPYEAQLDALEAVLCADTLTQSLGAAPLRSVTDLGLLLERYRTTVLEPIELPAILLAHREAAQGRAVELIELDRTFSGKHPEWLLLTPASTRVGRDYLNRLRPLQDERAVQRLIEAVRFGRTPGHHLTVFGLTMAVFSIAQRQGLAEYAQYALEAVVATAAGTLQLTQTDRNQLLARSQARLPDAIERMVA